MSRAPRQLEEKANRLRRSVRALQRMQGPVLDTGRGLCLLSQPATNGDIDIVRVTDALLEESSLDPLTFGSLLGVRGRIDLDSGRLRRWWRHFTILERGAADFATAAREGVAPLRSMRDFDLEAVLPSWRSRLVLLERLVTFSAFAGAADEIGEGRGRGSDGLLRDAFLFRHHVVDPRREDILKAVMGRGSPAELAALESDEDPVIAAEAKVRRTQGHARQDRSMTSLGAVLVAGGIDPAHVPDEVSPDEMTATSRVAFRLEAVFGPHVAARFVVWVTAWLHEDRMSRLQRLLEAGGAADRRRAVSALGRFLQCRREQILGDDKAVASLFDAVVLDEDCSWDQRSKERKPGWWRPRTSTAGLELLFRSFARTPRGGSRETGLRRHRHVHEALRHTANLAVLSGGADLEPSPATLSGVGLRDIMQTFSACGVDTSRVQAVWADVVEATWAGTAVPADAIEHVDPGLLRRAMRTGTLAAAGMLARRPRVLRRYLDIVEHVAASGGSVDWMRKQWFVDLVARGGAATVALLTLAHRLRDEITPDEWMGSFVVYADALSSAHPVLEAAIRDWARVEVIEPPAEAGPLPGLLDVSQAEIDAYLHYRRLAEGHEELSRAVRGPIELAEDVASQRAHVEHSLARDDLDPSERECLQARMDRLSDTDVQAGRLAAAARRARAALRAGTREYGKIALTRMLESAGLQAASGFLGRPLGAVPPHFADAFLLLTERRCEKEVLVSFLTDVLDGRRMRDREPNLRWIEAAAAAGLDTEVWVAGFDVSVTAGDDVFRVRTEDDPLHILRMGSYFDTCLALEDGFNAGATLANALDVNKHVVYVHDCEGNVVARKLVAATASGCAIGYVTYVGNVPDRDLLREATDAAVRGFMERCRLDTSFRSGCKPENLHDLFWYDDSPVPFEAEDREGDVESELAVVREARRRRDWDALLELAGHDEFSTVSRAAAFVFGREAPLAEIRRAGDSSGWPEVRLYVMLRGVEWLAARLREHFCFDADPELRELPLDPSEAGRSLRALARLDHCTGCAGTVPLSEAILTADIGAVRSMLRTWTRCKAEAPGPSASDILLLSAVSARRGAGSIRRLLADSHAIAETNVRIAANVPFPEAQRTLDAVLRSPAGMRRLETAALGLANLGAVANRDRLDALVERHPESLVLASAAAMSGSTSAAGVWRPPSEPEALLERLGDSYWCASVRMLDPKRLPRLLRRALREMRHPPEDVCAAIAGLGLGDLDARAIVALASGAAERERLAALWDQARRSRAALAGRSDPALADLLEHERAFGPSRITRWPILRHIVDGTTEEFASAAAAAAAALVAAGGATAGDGEDFARDVCAALVHLHPTIDHEIFAGLARSFISARGSVKRPVLFWHVLEQLPPQRRAALVCETDLRSLVRADPQWEPDGLYLLVKVSEDVPTWEAVLSCAAAADDGETLEEDLRRAAGEWLLDVWVPERRYIAAQVPRPGVIMTASPLLL